MRTVRTFTQTIKEVLPFYAPFKGTFLSVFLMLTLGQLLTLASPYLWGKIIDGVITQKPLYDTLLIAFAILVVALTGNLLAYIREMIELKRFDYAFPVHIAQVTLKKLLGFSLGQYLNHNSGMSLSVVNKGESALRMTANTVLWELLPLILQMTITIGALLFLSPPIGLVIFAGVGIYAAWSIIHNKYYFPKVKALEDRFNDRSKIHAETIRYMPLVKTFAQEERMVADYSTKGKEIEREAVGLWGGFLGVWYTRQGLTQIVQFIVLALAIYLVAKGRHTPGTIVTVIGWSNAVFAQLVSIGRIQRTLLNNSANIAKHLELINTEPSIPASRDGIVLPYLTGKIEFRNVTFSYPEKNMDDGSAEADEHPERPEERETLKNVSFTIEAGETCAFVGHSGSGKTTIVNLLLRAFDPEHGSILVDDHDLRVLDPQSYRRMIGLVEQSVDLFDETLRYNILFGVSEENRGDADVLLDEVARKARIDQFFDRLGEKKFDTIIGEKGVRLSGGERQRVGIARALIKDPHVLIFDEATSNLDAENEALIHDAMREALKGRTGIIIAHRLSTIKDADKIVVMEKGAVAGIGTHEELMRSCAQYQQLVERQVVTL